MGQLARQPPIGAAKLDRSNPLTRGLIYGWVGGDQCGFDLVSGSQWGVQGANPSRGVGAAGQGLYVGAFNYLNNGSFKTAAMGFGAPREVFGVVTPRDTTTTAFELFGYSGSNGAVIRGVYNTGLFQFSAIFVEFGGGPDIITGAATHHLNVPCTVSAYAAGPAAGAIGLVVNGVTEATGSASFQQTNEGGATNAVFPLSYNGGGGQTSLRHLSLYWNRVLSTAERASLHRNPWQIFQPIRARHAYSPPGGTNSATWTGAGGMQFGGVAARTLKRAFTTTNGLLFGGAGTWAALHQTAWTGVGGLVFAGTSAQTRKRVLAASSGLLFGGSASYLTSVFGAKRFLMISRRFLKVSRR